MCAMTHEDEGGPDDLAEERETRLELLARFAKGAASARFSARLGRPFSSAELGLAETFVAALGFPGAAIALVTDFEEAAEAALSLDLDSSAWEASEQLRVALTAAALELMGEELLEEALREVMAYVAVAVQDAVRDAAGAFDIEDEGLMNTAAGACLRACHNAALVLLAGEPEDHALALEYRLFEAGRWPVALTGQTLHLF